MAGTVVLRLTNGTSLYVADGVATHLQRTVQHKLAALFLFELVCDWAYVDLLPWDPIAVGREPAWMLEGLMASPACQSKLRRGLMGVFSWWSKGQMMRCCDRTFCVAVCEEQCSDPCSKWKRKEMAVPLSRPRQNSETTADRRGLAQVSLTRYLRGSAQGSPRRQIEDQARPKCSGRDCTFAPGQCSVGMGDSGSTVGNVRSRSVALADGSSRTELSESMRTSLRDSSSTVSLGDTSVIGSLSLLCSWGGGGDLWAVAVSARALAAAGSLARVDAAPPPGLMRPLRRRFCLRRGFPRTRGLRPFRCMGLIWFATRVCSCYRCHLFWGTCTDASGRPALHGVLHVGVVRVGRASPRRCTPRCARRLV